VSPRSRELLILRLPPDPGLARIVRRVVLHFLRQNGRRTRAARSAARSVERGCAAALRARTSRRRPARSGVLVLRLLARDGALEGTARVGAAPARRVLDLGPAGSP
jgi:hypothetical protein